MRVEATVCGWPGHGIHVRMAVIDSIGSDCLVASGSPMRLEVFEYVYCETDAEPVVRGALGCIEMGSPIA